MVWVASKGRPTVMHLTLEAASAEARRLRAKFTDGRAVYILAPVAEIPGRRILTLTRKPQRAVLEPETTGKAA